MSPDDLDLTSVNWTFGMLLTPQHFERQQHYHEAGLLWMLRNTTPAYGLVGGGPRIQESERGAVKYDPKLALLEDENSLVITVTQCRAITASGGIVEITPDRPITRKFGRAELEGVSEAGVYIVAPPFSKEVTEGGTDDFNPEIPPCRIPAYSLSLGLGADAGSYSACVGRIRRQRYGVAFEKDPTFIPACATMSAYSELTAGWQEIVQVASALADRYTELFRAMREFLALGIERGIETGSDAGAALFVEYMLTLLQAAVFDLLDPLQAPQRFFSRLKQLFYCAAVRFELTPAVQQYFDTLKQAGETEFTTLIQRQRSLLLATRSWTIGENLAMELRSALGSLSALQRLERAMEGKYLDFRISPSLEAMNFIFDRGGRVLYRLTAKASHVQGVGDDLRIYFSQLRLEGRDKYRLILIAEPGARFEKGERLTAELRINEGSGFRRAPLNMTSEAAGSEQCNFEFDFDAPDVPTITELVVAMPAHQQIRTALLFIRHRFYAERTAEAPRAEPLRPESYDEVAKSREYRSLEPERATLREAPGRIEPAPPRAPFRTPESEVPPEPNWPSARDSHPHDPRPRERGTAPWDRGPERDRPSDAELDPRDTPPPRRRRLE